MSTTIEQELSAPEVSVTSTGSVTDTSGADAVTVTEAGGIISPKEILRISWEGVVRNKVRSLLTMLGVIIGVAAVIIMIAISAGTEATISDQIEGLGSNLVFIQASFGRGGG
ncbi:MAG: ABC transporter permease, partial [Anaerolineae bacterium]|nr:ABC transporter permease [Anaerolineae bacterium]